jgi:hypoxanthine phosphoribosyltransferase
MIKIILIILLTFFALNIYIIVKSKEVFAQKPPEWLKKDKILDSILQDKKKKRVDIVHILTFIGCFLLPTCKLHSTLTWEKFEQDVSVFTDLIKPKAFDYIVGISSGGAFVAASLSIQTGIPYKIVKIKKYFANEIKKNLQVKELSGDFQKLMGKNVLIVDDQINTGDTIISALRHISSYSPNEVRLGVLYSTYKRSFIDYQPIRYVIGATPWGYDP